MLHTHQTPAESVVQFFRLIFTYALDLWEIIRKDVYDDFRNASLNKAANGFFFQSCECMSQSCECTSDTIFVKAAPRVYKQSVYIKHLRSEPTKTELRFNVIIILYTVFVL